MTNKKYQFAKSVGFQVSVSKSIRRTWTGEVPIGRLVLWKGNDWFYLIHSYRHWRLEYVWNGSLVTLSDVSLPRKSSLQTKSAVFSVLLTTGSQDSVLVLSPCWVKRSNCSKSNQDVWSCLEFSHYIHIYFHSIMSFHYSSFIPLCQDLFAQNMLVETSAAPIDLCTKTWRFHWIIGPFGCFWQNYCLLTKDETHGGSRFVMCSQICLFWPLFCYYSRCVSAESCSSETWMFNCLGTNQSAKAAEAAKATGTDESDGQAESRSFQVVVPIVMFHCNNLPLLLCAMVEDHWVYGLLDV